MRRRVSRSRSFDPVALLSLLSVSVSMIAVGSVATRNYRLETGIDTRYLLREPTLSRDQNIATTSAFGAFLIREWRF